MPTLNDLLKVLSQSAECIVQYLDLFQRRCWGARGAIPDRQNTDCLDLYVHPNRKSPVPRDATHDRAHAARRTTVVLAPPGGGKTFFLRALAARIARRSRNRVAKSQCLFDDAWIPFFIHGTELLIGNDDFATAIVNTQLGWLGCTPAQRTSIEPILIAAIRKKNACIIIDDIATFPKWFLTQLNDSRCRVVVSCRQDHWRYEPPNHLSVNREVTLEPFGRSRQQKLACRTNCATSYPRIRAVCGPGTDPYAVIAIAKSKNLSSRPSLSVPVLFRELADGNWRTQQAGSPPYEEFRKNMAKAMFKMFMGGRNKPRSAEFTREGFVESTNGKFEALWNEACARGVVVRSGGTHSSKGDSYYTTTDPRFLPWLLAAGFASRHVGDGQQLLAEAKRLLKRGHAHWQQMLFDYLPAVLESEQGTTKLALAWQTILLSHGNWSLWRWANDFIKW